MIKIVHRVNDIKKLLTIPKEYGIEIDIHGWKDDLTIHHDPFKKGENLDEFLKYFHHSFVILNVKEEGVENKVRE